MSRINIMPAKDLRAELARLDAEMSRTLPSSKRYYNLTEQHQRLTWERNRRLQHGGSLQPLRIPNKRGRK